MRERTLAGGELPHSHHFLCYVFVSSRVYSGFQLMRYETMIMSVGTEFISLHWPSNVIGKKGHQSKVYVSGSGFLWLLPTKTSRKIEEVVQALLLWWHYMLKDVRIRWRIIGVHHTRPSDAAFHPVFFWLASSQWDLICCVRLPSSSATGCDQRNR